VNHFDAELREVLGRMLPDLAGRTADWEDVLARLPARRPTACRGGARRARFEEPGPGREAPAVGDRPKSVPRLEQGWGTRPLDQRSGTAGLQLLPEALGWGTRPI
jgi:hypothetical protein